VGLDPIAFINDVCKGQYIIVEACSGAKLFISWPGKKREEENGA
jgi:hypothetical protein